MERGISNNQKSSTVAYFTVSNGFFVKRVSEPTQHSTARILEKGPNAGKEVHEEHITDIVGKLVDITIEESREYGDSWNFKLDCSTDQEELTAIIKVQISSSYAKQILSRLPNMDLEKDVCFRSYCFYDKTKGKNIMGITTMQSASSKAKGETKKDGGINVIKVEPHFTKENPNGLPDMEQIIVKGKPVWDDSKQLFFYEALVRDSIRPQLGATGLIRWNKQGDNANVQANSQSRTPHPADNQPNAKKVNDLPF